MLSENMLWTRHLIESERKCRVKFLKAVHRGEYSDILYKLDQYLVLVGKFANFTTLVVQLNEAEEDIDQFTALVSGGYYKACLLTLRSHFEIYMNMAKSIKASNQLIGQYEKQRNEKSRHFSIKGLAKKEGNLEKEIYAIYDELSRNAHSTGRSHGNIVYNHILPILRYDPTVVRQCFKLLERSIDAATAVYVLCTTDTMKKQDILISIFGSDIFGGSDPIEEQAITWLKSNIRDQSILL